MAWRSPASEVNLRAIDETVVHVQNVTGVDCKICLYILALYLLRPSVRLSATVALGLGTLKNCSLCLPRVFDGGGRRKKKLWVQGLWSVVIMDAYFHVPHNKQQKI